MKIKIEQRELTKHINIAQKAISVTAKAVTNFAKSSVQSGMTFDKLKEQVRPEAVTRIQTSLVLEQIAKEENIEVSDEEERMYQEYLRKQGEL